MALIDFSNAELQRINKNLAMNPSMMFGLFESRLLKTKNLPDDTETQCSTGQGYLQFADDSTNIVVYMGTVAADGNCILIKDSWRITGVEFKKGDVFNFKITIRLPELSS